MATFGRACLMLALAAAVYGALASLLGARRRQRQWTESGRRAVYALFGLSALAFAALEVAFLRSDFALDVVASHSSTTTPLFYRATAVWSSQEGSLLLWLLLLSGWSSLVLFATRRHLREIAPYATAVLLGLGAFFAFLLVFLANPFDVSSSPPAEGAGLNPLLRHPSMMVHPPALYSGYTLFTIPFAFAVGALVTRRVDAEWIRATRRFTLAAWLFLGIGILLGARWSYSELGWGGYWAWDAVENASLMPWLTGTAFLHSVMIQERRGMLKVWNASLILATGVLAVLGTFLVRSGILDSIHAFGASTLGLPFVALIGVLVAGSVALVVSRRDALRSEHRLDSLVSREAVFILNNLVLVGLCFVVFWGTFFPLISEAVTGQKAAVGPPWFSRYTVPLGLVLVLLSGVGPAMTWRRVSGAGLRRALALPAVVGLGALGVLMLAGVDRRPRALLMFALGAFVLAVVAGELWRGVRARRAMAGGAVPVALVALVRRNRRRYGGYLVHAGVAVLFMGIAASTAFQHARDVTLAVGQSARVGGYDIRYVRASYGLAGSGQERGTGALLSLGAVLDVSRHGRHVTMLHPEREFYPSNNPADGPVGQYFAGEPTSEVGLRAGPWRDLWTAFRPDTGRLQARIDLADRQLARVGPFAGYMAAAALVRAYAQDPPPATFRMIVSPLVSWIWLGGLIVMAGGLIAVWPSPQDRRARQAVALRRGRLARELGSA